MGGGSGRGVSLRLIGWVRNNAHDALLDGAGERTAVIDPVGGAAVVVVLAVEKARVVVLVLGNLRAALVTGGHGLIGEEGVNKNATGKEDLPANLFCCC